MNGPATRRLAAAALGAAVLVAATPAHAIPAFARKYGTSCLTCHTVYPKLNAFGEAFRRNGYLFPGKDSDFIKQDMVQLGQDQAKQEFPKQVWPGWVMSAPPIAVGFNGVASLHPDTGKTNGATQPGLDNGSTLTLNSSASMALLGEAHLWAGGSISENTTFFGEVTFSSDGTLEVESGRILFNNLFGPKHAFNLTLGKSPPTLTSFGWHSSYIADTFLTPLSVTALYGGSGDSAFDVTGAYQNLELNGMFGGRVDYSVGLTEGAQVDTRPAEGVYAHVGFKVGGMRLDGEGASGPPNAERPWEETALIVDGFFYRSASHYQPGAYASGDTSTTPGPADDASYTYGGDLRASLASFELNAGGYYQTHDHAAPDAMGGFAKLDAFTTWGEASYVVYPWLVPAVRLEYSHVDPANADSMSDLRIIPGVAALVLPNVKMLLTAQVEMAQGMPIGGASFSWTPANGFATPTTPTGKVTEIESVNLYVAYAF